MPLRPGPTYIYKHAQVEFRQGGVSIIPASGGPPIYLQELYHERGGVTVQLFEDESMFQDYGDPGARSGGGWPRVPPRDEVEVTITIKVPRSKIVIL